MAKNDYIEMVEILKKNGHNDLADKLIKAVDNNNLILLKMRGLIANDSYAITFQSMAQYRNMLLKVIDGYLYD